MKLTVIIIILLSLSMLTAISIEQYNTSPVGVSANMRDLRTTPLAEDSSADNDDGLDTVSYISNTFALPYESASVQLNRATWNVFNSEGEFLNVVENNRSDAAIITNSFTFREMQGFTIKLKAQYQENGYTYTLKDIDYQVNGTNPIAVPTAVSPAFIDAYRTLADNWDTCYLRNLPLSQPKMLIISHTQLTDYLADFIKWKRQQGFIVYVANKNEIGTSLDDFKSYIANHYDQYHCDYVLLLGDVNGSYSIPTGYFPSPEYQENDADDHQYSMITGDDYFPELLIGRFSFSNVSEFITMASKSIGFEKSPSMTDTNWMRRAITVAGNYAEGGLRPTTPIHMSRWLRDRLLDYGYTAVDTVYYPPTYPGTSLIQSSINQGVQFVSYRGWGDANGWHYPSFHLADLNSTFNGPKMPVVFSIVCNTGDFANSVNPSFGEKWMRMGTMTSPGGCVAFVGPSDLHTKTRLNNSISSGAFRSILDFGVRGFGSSVLNGKMELYKNFPNDLAENQYVNFYFHVYNLQADPSLNMWVLVPDQIQETAFAHGLQFKQSDSHIEFNPDGLDGAIITATKNGTDFSYIRVTNNTAILPIDSNLTGDLTVTISKANKVPLVRTISPSAAAAAGVLAAEIQMVGSQMNAEYVIKSFSTGTINNVECTLSTLNPDMVTFGNPSQTVASLAPNATSNLIFPFSLAANVNPREQLVLKMEIRISGNPAVVSTHLLQFYPPNAQFVILSHSGSLNIGSTNQITFSIQNNGLVGLSNASLYIHSRTNAATVNPETINLGNFASGETKQVTASINVVNGTYEGRNLPFWFRMNGDDVYFPSPTYSVVAGNPGPDDPTGPCEYGYYAYDSFDAAYAQKPVYDWVEIDPRDGGNGAVYLIQDDGSKVLNLPFTFRYYGQNYNQITICSNGWLAFGATDMVDFYNHYIPAALGPYAMVAGYWDDLKGMKTGTDDEGNGIFNDMRLIYWHDTANNRYIVEWNDAYNQYTIEMMQNASLEKFQIILYPQTGRDGDIVIQYHTVDNPGTTTNYCTVGIEDHLQLDGITYTHGNQYPLTASTLQAGLAVKFTTIAPDNTVGNDDDLVGLPFELLQNYPNPFNPETTISFNAKAAGTAKLSILNMRGQVVRTLLNERVPAGMNSLVWNGLDNNGQKVSSGLYFYRLDLGNSTQTRKMLLIK